MTTQLTSPRRPAAPPVGAAPRHRPPAGARAVLGVLGLVTIAFGAALMLADRAPRLIRRVLGGFARRLSDRIDAGGRSPVSLDARPGEGDWIVHLGLWSIAVVFVALMLWTSRGLWLAALGVFALSVVIEIGQGVWSTTRTVEFSDVVFNALGVAIGAAVAHGVFVAWDAAVSRARRRTAAR